MTKQVIAVTGAGGVLGAFVCARLSAAGHDVVGIDVTSEIKPSEGLKLALSGTDLADEQAAFVAFKTIEQQLGSLTGLANIAGGFRWEPIAEGDSTTWDALWAMNVKTALHASRAALPMLARSGGSIVNVSAAATARAETGMGAYTATKSAVSRMTEALAAEWKDRGVRVNAVLPSIIDTPANRNAMPDGDFTRWVRPEALTEVVMFLLSNQASAVTGALLPVMGRM